MIGLESYYKKMEWDALQDSDFVKKYKSELIKDEEDPIKRATLKEDK